ncbi:hypothetical protein GCM10007269_20910 [Microbacterium murale]|uniref:Uncharacterized protein n=1 Tax=Microbacterium murale TaxID=1081040 RepID=A0ABQ1RTR5_9MICO|nr:hypothetical protein GCM10007269_20910 [Microbacterium murale]
MHALGDVRIVDEDRLHTGIPHHRSDFEYAVSERVAAEVGHFAAEGDGLEGALAQRSRRDECARQAPRRGHRLLASITGRCRARLPVRMPVALTRVS